MGKAATEQRDFRNERKFTAPGLSTAAVEAIILSHPALFSRSFPDRYVNNIYLEDNSFGSYASNVAGIARRNKVRIRWYGHQFGYIEKPTLEIKMKRGLAGAKENIPLAAFSLDHNFSLDTLRQVYQRSGLTSEIQEMLEGLSPALLNRYRRKYFLSADRKFRVTVDDGLSFVRISRYGNTFLQRVRNRGKIVVELKYDVAYDEAAGRISDYFPFRLAKNSKYVNGLDNLDPW